MALPQITVENYPQGGKTRIAELTLSYHSPARTLEHGAAGGGHHPRGLSVRPLPREPVGKRRSFCIPISGRFTYTEEQTQTPIYSLLCEGYARAGAWRSAGRFFAREVRARVSGW